MQQSMVRRFMERFITSYKKVFKKNPIITISERNHWHNVEGLGCAHPTTWGQVSMYFNTVKDPLTITKEKCEVLQTWYDKGHISTKAISIVLQIPIANFRTNLQHKNNIWDAYKTSITIGTRNTPLFGINGNKYTAHRWGKELGMSINTFKSRLNKYGPDCWLVFLTVEEYKKIDRATKDKLALPGKASNYTSESKIKVETLDTDIQVSYSQALNVVAHIINDAKKNMIKKHKEFFVQSKLFLMNSNGQLRWLIEPIKEINTERALKELYQFALHDYKHSVEVDNVIVKKVIPKRIIKKGSNLQEMRSL